MDPASIGDATHHVVLGSESTLCNMLVLDGGDESVGLRRAVISSPWLPVVFLPTRWEVKLTMPTHQGVTEEALVKGVTGPW